MRVLLVEDDVEMASVIGAALTKRGAVVDHVTTLEHGREAMVLKLHDVMLLDRNLPDGDGVELLAEMRQQGIRTPVIMLTAHNEPADRIAGLDVGADDYIGKPFLPDELMARIRAAARRFTTYESSTLTVGNLSFDTNSSETRVEQKVVTLPRREALLLKALLRRPNTTVLRAALEDAVYGFDDEIQSNALDSQVSRLRKRLGDAGASVTIHAIRGVGYLLR